MSSFTGNEAAGRRVQLLPHQQSFIEDLMLPASKGVTLLRAEVGLGKSNALAALASRVLAENAFARVLFVVHAALREQIAAVLVEHGARSLLVDRYKYREIIDAEGRSWPAGVALVVGREFAKKAEVRASLASCRWNLVVIDDVQGSESWRQLFSAIAPNSEQVLISAGPHVRPSEAVPAENVRTIDWKREQLLDHDGVRLDAAPRPTVRTLSFQRTQTERDLERELREIAPHDAARGATLVRTFHSSQAALESAMTALLADSQVADDEELEEEQTSPTQPDSTPVSEDVKRRALAVIGKLEEFPRDGKLEALMGLLETLEGTGRICILTDYIATLYYVCTEIEIVLGRCHIFHGGMTFDDRLRSLREFLEAPTGILVASRAAMGDGIFMGEVTDLVFFDVPADDASLSHAIGRFDRVGRTSRLNIHVMREGEKSVATDRPEPSREGEKDVALDHPDTSAEIAVGFTADDYRNTRRSLDLTRPDTDGWPELRAVFRRRIEERFLQPIAELLSPRSEQTVPGFAVLALDCLLIDTLQSFREGRVATGEISPAKSFTTFLKSPRFDDFNRADRDDFFHYVRNALLHNGETRGDWRVRADTRSMLTRTASGARIINRTLFHKAIVEEFNDYCRELESGDVAIRERFLQRMDAISGLAVQPGALYFAYGSNLLDAEILKTAPTADLQGVAFLPGWKLSFTKHSTTREGDAASIEPDPSCVVWGVVYRISATDKELLKRREGGYRELSIRALIVDDVADCSRCIPVDAFTFVAESPCPDNCGPATSYLQLVVNGARARGLPDQYIEELDARRTRSAVSMISPEIQPLVDFPGYGPADTAAVEIVFFGQEERCAKAVIELNQVERRRQSFPRDKDAACRVLASACEREGFHREAAGYLAAIEPGGVPQWEFAARFAKHFFSSESWQSEYRALGKSDGRTFLAERFPLPRPSWKAHQFADERVLIDEHLAVLRRDLIAKLKPGTLILSYAGPPTDLLGHMVVVTGNQAWSAIPNSNEAVKVARAKDYPLVVLSAPMPREGDEESWEQWLGDAALSVKALTAAIRENR